MGKKVILIGVDGATWDLIIPWVEQGELPAFQKIMSHGSWGKLQSTIPPLSPPAWTSIFTGTNPGKHNIFGFLKRKKDSYFVTPISSNDREAVPLWKYISGSGRRSVLLNIPFSYPPDKINGIMTTGLGTPSRDSDFTHPKDFKKRLLKEFPEFDVDFNEDLIELGSDRDPADHIIKITASQIAAAKKLLVEEECDLFAAVFRSTDVVQHYYWYQEEMVLKTYKQIDCFMEWVQENLRPDQILMICSDHGFAPIHTNIYVNNWLERAGFLSLKKGLKKKKKKGTSGVLPSAEAIQVMMLKMGLKNLVSRLKRSSLVEPLIRSLFSSDRVQYLFDIDWERSKSYFLDGSFGMININLKGREPKGCISKKDREKMIQIIMRKARDIKDAASGGMVIEEIFRGEDVYHGQSSRIPDIVLVSKEGYNLVGGYNYSGEITEKVESRFGEHSKYGIFALQGQGVENKKDIDGLEVYDISPTIMRVLGMDIPRSMDGKVMGEVLDHKLFSSSTEKPALEVEESLLISEHIGKIDWKKKL